MKGLVATWEGYPQGPTLEKLSTLRMLRHDLLGGLKCLLLGQILLCAFDLNGKPFGPKDGFVVDVKRPRLNGAVLRNPSGHPLFEGIMTSAPSPEIWGLVITVDVQVRND